MVLSAGLLTQLYQSIEDAGLDSSSTVELVIELRRQHLRILLELARIGGAVVLVTDTVSTASAPELAILPRQRLGERLAQLIDRRNFFTGTNSVQLRSVLTRDGDIVPRVAEIRFYEPWLWPLTANSEYLVYAVSFRKDG